MFFVFQFLIIVFLLQPTINSFSLGRNNNLQKQFFENEKYVQFQDVARRNASLFTNYYRTILNMLQNDTKTTIANLKANEFDKMLSEEMFSVKQLLYNRDRHTPTPTLEIRQRWPIIELMSKLDSVQNPEENRKNYEGNIQRNIESNETCNFNKELNVFNDNKSVGLVDNTELINFKPESEVDEEETSDKKLLNEVNENKDKVIELRSLNDVKAKNLLPAMDCTFKNKQRSTCTSHLQNPTENSKNPYTRSVQGTKTLICSQSSKLISSVVGSICPSSVLPTCLSVSTVTPTSYPKIDFTVICPQTCPTCNPLISYVTPNSYYVPYQFLYQPLPEYYTEKTINHRKIKKPKYKPSKEKMHDEDSDESKENYDDYLDNDEQLKSTSTHKIESDEVKLIALKKDQCESSCTRMVSDGSKAQLVDIVINDLKTYYPDSVIKDCFCQVASFSICTLELSFTIICMLLILFTLTILV